MPSKMKIPFTTCHKLRLFPGGQYMMISET